MVPCSFEPAFLRGLVLCSLIRLRERERKGEGGWIRLLNMALAQAKVYMMESLILAQNERWRHVLSMQVGRQWGQLHESGERVSNT